METLGQYVLSVSTAAILCGLVLSMISKGCYHSILRLICGVFLALLVVQPITKFDPDRILSLFNREMESDAEAAAALGEDLSRDSMSAYIKRETEAYILDKAHALGVTVEAEVTLGKDDLPVPVSAVIRGDVPEAMRRKLEQLITDDLGIAKENLQWIGQR